jgi:predicted dinucleotide-binding enzyme
VLARLATAAGYRVLIAGSGAVDRIALIVEVMAPDAIATTAEGIVAEADVVILAVPLGKVGSLPLVALSDAHAIVVDATNYWWPVDGILPAFEQTELSSSEIVSNLMPGARLVKTFNHMGYHELDSEARPAGHPDRKALAIASDDPAALVIVAEVVDAMGFDTIDAGALVEGIRFEPGTPAFGATASRVELVAMLEADGNPALARGRMSP